MNWPANMMVAPNSPSARAQHRIAPPNNAGAETGAVTKRNTCHSDAPSARAASSSSRGTLRKPDRAARAGFLGVPRELEEAARVEGANEWQVFRFVSVPVAAPALFGGAVLCWARALGEFGATIMFAGQFLGRTQTMPLAIYAALESDVDAALALSVLLLAISFALLVLFRRWLSRVNAGMS